VPRREIAPADKRMHKKRVITAALLLLGLTLLSAAIFANALGLDQHGGWGRARSGVLALGVLVMFLAGAYYRYGDNPPAIVRRIRGWVQEFLIPAQLREDPGAGRVGKLWQDYWITLPIVAIVLGSYTWFASSGHWTRLDGSTRHYSYLSIGFRHGHLYLPIEPDPLLSEAANPYDPHQRGRAKVPRDVSFYEGKFYIYWGPVPALMLLPVEPFIKGWVADSHLAFGFTCGIFLVQYVLLAVIWDRYFRRMPKWILYLSICVAGLAGPALFLRHNFESAKIYEAAIIGGQFFLMSGFAVALASLQRSAKTGWLLACAGILWALSIGTRVVLAPSVAFLLLMVAYWMTKDHRRPLGELRKLIPLVSPVVVCLLLLAWYNWARFGSVTETGSYYVLGSRNVQPNYADVSSLWYIMPNLYNYLLHPFKTTSQFPFLYMKSGVENGLWSFTPVPELYYPQPITGILYVFPFALFAATIARVSRARLSATRSKQNNAVEDKQAYLNWIALSLGGAALITLGLVLVFFWAAVRFQEDFLPPLTTLAILGFWRGYESLEQRPVARRIYAILGVILAVASIVVGTLLAISTNPVLSESIRSFPSP